MDLSDGGIVFSLELSIFMFILFLIAFWILRKSARATINQSTQPTSSHFGAATSGESVDSPLLGRQPDHDAQAEFTHRGWFASNEDDSPSLSPDQQPKGSSGVTLLGWVWATLKISDEEMRLKCGTDALHYLKFQLMLIRLSFVICIFSLGVVLPINVSGSEHYKSMASTTITNLKPDSMKLWVHTTFFVLYSALGWIFFARFVTTVKKTLSKSTLKFSNTLMISNMPLSINDPDVLRKHFEAIYKDVEITDIRFVPDIDRLCAVHEKKIRSEHKLERYETIFSHTGRRPQISVNGSIHICCCGRIFGKRVDAINYYDAECEKYCRRFEGVLDKELELIGVAFVTFKHHSDMITSLRDSHLSLPRVSHLSSLLKPNQWITSIAPAPTDVIWTHLKDDHVWWYLRFFIVNVALFVVLMFWTTPVAILSALGPLKQADIFSGVSQYIAESPFLTAYLPTLMMWILTLLLPWIVAASSMLEFHHAKSKMELSVVRKSYAYYIINVIILPSFLMTSVDAVLRLSKDKEEFMGKFECVFLANNGAFFVNYLIIAAFIGNGFELLRLPEIILSKIYSFGAYTYKEKMEAIKAASFSFYYGREYSYLLCVFCLVMVFCTTCPLVVPGGLVYFTIKHLVDKYNIYHVRLHEYESDGGIVNTVSNQYLTSMLVAQIMFLGLCTVKLGSENPQTYLVMAVTLLNAGIMIGKRCRVKYLSFYADQLYARHSISLTEEEDALLTSEESSSGDEDLLSANPATDASIRIGGDELDTSAQTTSQAVYLPPILQEYRTLNNPSSSSRSVIP